MFTGRGAERPGRGLKIAWLRVTSQAGKGRCPVPGNTGTQGRHTAQQGADAVVLERVLSSGFLRGAQQGLDKEPVPPTGEHEHSATPSPDPGAASSTPAEGGGFPPGPPHLCYP